MPRLANGLLGLRMGVVGAGLLAVILARGTSAGPMDVPGLVLWLDADAQHVTKDSGQRVSKWSDLTGKTNNTASEPVDQKDRQRQPRWVDKAIGGRPALYLDGRAFLHNTSSNLVVAGGPRTIFVVGRLDERSRGGSIFAFRRSASDTGPLFGVNLLGVDLPPSKDVAAPFLVYTDGWHRNSNTSIEGARDAMTTIRRPFLSAHQSAGAGSTIAVEINGVPQTINAVVPVRTEGGSTGFTVGGSENLPKRGWHGLIAELLVYDRNLEPAERQTIISYLAAKYGIETTPVEKVLRPASPPARRPETLAAAITLENGHICTKFDNQTGSLIQLTNKDAGETCDVWGDEFEIRAQEFTLRQKDMLPVVLSKTSDEELKATYRAESCTVVAAYRLRHHFIEKQLTVTSSLPYGFAELVVSRPGFGGVPVRFIKYKHLKTDTYFGRTPRGGVFAGVELPFDRSARMAENVVTLGYEPSMKVRANETIVCEPIYLGVYRKGAQDREAAGLPLPSESDAMVAMTTALLAPKNQRLNPKVCGWWSELTREPYVTPADAAHDMRCIDFAVDCGIDLVMDGRPWAGELAKVDALRDDDKLQLGDLTLKVASYARQKGVRWMFWSSMNVSDPTYLHKQTPYRPDKPEWRMPPHHANNFGCRAFFEWWLKVNLDAMDAGKYQGWGMDGDFFGTGGYTRRVNCSLIDQDHIYGDVTYLCERNLLETARVLRERYPDVFIYHCRPAMDLGVWSLRYCDASFTIDEHAVEVGLAGMGPQPPNVLLGDKIRSWARVRMQHHFFPHVLDSPQLFVFPKSLWPEVKHGWLSEHLDYILLSALSCSPNQTYYLPCATGIPAADKQEIKKWLDWGRQNIRYLTVRKDLPDWPQVGKVDGSAHVIGDGGYVFLFNPNSKPLDGAFALDESIGLSQGQDFRVEQFYPPLHESRGMVRGQKVVWNVPAQTVCVLKIKPK